MAEPDRRLLGQHRSAAGEGRLRRGRSRGSCSGSCRSAATDDYGLFGRISQITAEGRAKILGENVAAYRGWDIEQLKQNIAGDEFSGHDGAVTPYSTTSVSDRVVSSNGGVAAPTPVPAA